MAKEKLLRFLTLIFVTTISVSSMSSFCMAASTSHGLQNQSTNIEKLEDEEWLEMITSNSKEMNPESMMKKLEGLGLFNAGGDDKAIEEIMKPKQRLRIFVSSSMPMNLLRQYHKQASIYEGTLVFKGLPGGSFKELSKLVLEIAEQGEVGSMEIDDEAFDKFGVASVPVIVLSSEKDCMGEASCAIIYDKISGNLDLKFALELFSNKGDLAGTAKKILSGVN